MRRKEGHQNGAPESSCIRTEVNEKFVEGLQSDLTKGVYTRFESAAVYD